MATDERPERPRWTYKERGPFAALVVAFILSTPGLGPEDRPAPSGAILALLTAAFLVPAVASFATSWKWPVRAARIGVAAGLVIITVIGLDLVGVLVGPPPQGMIALDVVIALIGAAMSWQCWKFARRAA